MNLFIYSTFFRGNVLCQPCLPGTVVVMTLGVTCTSESTKKTLREFYIRHARVVGPTNGARLSHIVGFKISSLFLYNIQKFESVGGSLTQNPKALHLEHDLQDIPFALIRMLSSQPPSSSTCQILTQGMWVFIGVHFFMFSNFYQSMSMQGTPSLYHF